jgi:predicted phage-related endonuclease
MTVHIPLSIADRKKAKARWGRVPRTAARPVLKRGATESEWLAARRRDGGRWRIGASELAAVAGCSPHTSAFSLWWAKQDTWVHPEANTAMVVGHKLEDVIGGLWAETHPEMLLFRPGSALYGHPDPVHDWLVCTPDFLAVRDVREIETGAGPLLVIEPVECKSDEGGKGWGKPGTDEVPEHHRIQVYVQCEVLGAKRGHLMRLAGKRPAAYVLPYDREARAFMADLLAQGAAFIQSLADDIPPDLDGHKATTEALQTIHGAYVEGKTVTLPGALIAEFQLAHDQLDTAKAELDESKNRIRQALADAQLGTDAAGSKVVKRNIYKRRGYEVGPAMVDELRRMS